MTKVNFNLALALVTSDRGMCKTMPLPSAIAIYWRITSP